MNQGGDVGIVLIHFGEGRGVQGLEGPIWGADLMKECRHPMSCHQNMAAKSGKAENKAILHDYRNDYSGRLLLPPIISTFLTTVPTGYHDDHHQQYHKHLARQGQAR